MQEDPREHYFDPETIDEQIAHLAQGTAQDPAIARLVNDLERAYREEREEEQAIERIRERLIMRATQTQSIAGQQMQPHQGEHELPRLERISRMMIREEKANRHAWKRQWSVLAAALIAAMLVGSLIAILHTKGSTTTSGLTKQQETATASAVQTYPGMYIGMNSQIIKLDLRTHNVLWRYTVKSVNKDIIPHLSPVVVGKNVYFYVPDGSRNFGALDAQTGVLKWQRSSGGPLHVVNNVVYIANGKQVTVINPTDGSPKMQYQVSGGIAGIFEGVMYMVSHMNVLAAIRMSDGKQLWQTQISADQDWTGHVYVKKGVLYAAASAVAPTSQDSYLYTIDPQSGKITWQSPLINGLVFDITVGDDGKVYCGAQNHLVYAFDPKTKSKPSWTYHTITGHVFAPPLVQNGIVYVGQASVGSHNDDHLVALDPATGQQKWATPVQGYTGIADLEPPVLDNGVIYLCTEWGVQGFDANNGKLIVTISSTTLLGADKGAHTYIMDIAITIVR